MINDTTQFLLDVFRCRDRLYIRPVKVQHRSAAAMNLIHAWEDGDYFRPVTDSGTVSEILAGSGWPGLDDNPIVRCTGDVTSVRRVPWPNCGAREAGLKRSHSGSTAFANCFPTDPAMSPLIRQYLHLDDLLAIRDRMIGIGSIGGKALELLLARAILRRDAPALHAQLEAHDSFFVGTEVFRRFSCAMDCGGSAASSATRPRSCSRSTRRTRASCRERLPHRPCSSSKACSITLASGHSSFVPVPGSRTSLATPLPASTRASSAPTGAREKRLADLLRNAVRQVYASTLGDKALRYRQRRGLLDAHEQMALLIMRVSGTAGHRYFHPHAAGVGLSFNPYRWNPRIDMQAGVVRLVAGLGTRAVDRADDDYTRLIALNEPELRPETNFGAIARRAQRRMDALDLDENKVITGPFVELVDGEEDFPLPCSQAASNLTARRS